MTQVETCSIRLKTWFRRDGGTWIAWCRAINVLSQAETKQGAVEAIREAVELWFESCVERGVLVEALGEVGFVKASPADTIPDDVDSVTIRNTTSPDTVANRHGLAFKVGKGRDRDCIEAIIPAHLLAARLGEDSGATSQVD